VRVFPDTNVLFSVRLINLIMRTHEARIIDVVWSDDLMIELRRIFVERRQMSEAKADHVVDQVRRWSPSGRIARAMYADLVPRMTGPDPTDHVHSAAARAGRVDVLLTNNIRDFPRRDIGRSCQALTPATFFGELGGKYPKEFARIINESSVALRRPPKTPEMVLNDLEEIGLVAFARIVRTELRR
jgi:hypothetical protein